MSESTVGPEGQETAGPVDISEMDFSSFPGVSDQPSTEAPAQGGDNPAWAPFLEGIPDVFHETLKARLREQDKQVNERFQQYGQQVNQFKPYEDIIRQGIDPRMLEASVQFGNRVRQDPLGVFHELRQALIQRGDLTDEQASKAAASAVEGQQGNVEDPYDQRLAELEANNQQLREGLQQFFTQAQQEQQMNEAVAQETQLIDRGFANVEQQLGQVLPDNLKGEILQRAMVMGQQQNRPVTIEEAAAATFRFISETRGQIGRTAPRGIPSGGGGGAAFASKNPGEMSDSESKAAAMDIMRSMGFGQ